MYSHVFVLEKGEGGRCFGVLFVLGFASKP